MTIYINDIVKYHKFKQKVISFGIEYETLIYEDFINKHVKENSVDEIRSRHMFEHLTYAQGKKSLRSWHKILKNGGKVQLNMPDLYYHVKEYIRNYDNRKMKHISDSFVHAIAGIYGWQKETEDSSHFTAHANLWGIHKSGYDEISLKKLIKSLGYKAFIRNPNDAWHLDVTFYK